MLARPAVMQEVRQAFKSANSRNSERCTIRNQHRDSIQDRITTMTSFASDTRLAEAVASLVVSQSQGMVTHGAREQGENSAQRSRIRL